MGLSTSLKFLVIGAQGVIGSALWNRLSTKNFLVYGSTHHEIESNQFFYLNLLDPPSDWKIPAVRFDVVYLCAGISHLLTCEERPQMTYPVNVLAMSELIKRLSSEGAFIVYLSTSHVFSGEKPFVLAESFYSPQNEYGRQKMLVEQFIQSHCKKWAILRLNKVISPNLALIKGWLESLDQGLTINAFKDKVFSPISLRQVIDLLLKIGEIQQAGCFQLSGADDISYEVFAKKLAQYRQISESQVVGISALQGGMRESFLPRFTTLDCSSTINVFNEKPPSALEVIQDFLKESICLNG